MNGLRRAALPFTASALLLWGCVGSSGSQGTDVDPDRSGSDSAATAAFDGVPSIRGTVTALEGLTIRVEEDPSEPSGSAKAIVRISERTSIRQFDGRPAVAADIDVGEVVSVWFTGPVAESYPVQATGGAIEVGQVAAP